MGLYMKGSLYQCLLFEQSNCVCVCGGVVLVYMLLDGGN